MNTRPEAEAIPYVDTGHYFCEKCHRQVGIGVLPQSPRFAKHRCPYCHNLNEVETRPSGFDELAGGPGKFDDHVGEGKERNKFERRAPVSVQVSPHGYTVTDRRAGHADKG